MRLLTRSAALFALSSLPAAITAVSLSDMQPRAQNLPTDCDKIYESQISGCGVSDFTSRSCTDTCVSALQAMVGPIKEACGGQGVTGSNLVVAFLANVGPQQICPDADLSGSTAQSTASPSPSPSPTSAASSAATTETSSEDESTSLLVDTSSATRSTRTRTPSFSGTTTARTLTEESSGAPTTTTTTSASASTTDDGGQADAAQQGANDQSGGGSPFDDEGNMFSGADSLSSASVLVSLGIAVVVCVFLFR